MPYGVTDFMVKAHRGIPKSDKAVPTGVLTHVRVDVAPGLATSSAGSAGVQARRNSAKKRRTQELGLHLGFYLAPDMQKGAGPHETAPKAR